MSKNAFSERNREIGKRNRETIRRLLAVCPGITRTEIAQMLNMSVYVVGRHVSALRAEWGAKPIPTRSGQKK